MATFPKPERNVAGTSAGTAAVRPIIHSIVTALPDIISRYGPDLRYQFISPAVERATGIPPQQFIGKSHAEVGLPQHLCEWFDASLREVFKTGQTSHLDWEVRDAQGNLRYFFGTAIPEFGPDGRVTHVLTVTRDVTEFRAAEEALRRSEGDLRLILDSAPALVAYVDRNLCLRRVNRTFEQWYGKTEQQVLGRSLREIIGAQNFQRIEANLARVLRGEQVRFETTNDYVDKRRHVLITYTPDFGEDSEVRGFVALITDITDRRDIEDALKESEQRFRTIAETVPAILYSNRADGTCDYVSPRFLEFTGLTEQDALSGWSTAVHPHDLPRLRTSWTESLRRGTRHMEDFRFRRHDGVYRWFRAWNVPVKDEDGNVVRWYGACLDVDDHVRGEEALRKSEKLAAVGRLAASISHEINNPLESVTNLLYLINSDPSLSADTRKHVQTAQEELARVAAIATQTLRFYRQSTRRAKADVNSFVRSALSLVSGRIRNLRVELTEELDAKQQLECFESELRQVIINLVTNALDALVAPDLKLRVRTRDAHHWKTGQPGVRITISDSGHGMSPATQRQLFEPFFTTKGLTGTGLGLWVSLEIVQKHHGTMRVRSTVNPKRHGTTFTVFIPTAAQ